MNMKINFYHLIVLAVFLASGLSPATAEDNKKFKVLVVFSYEENKQWDKDIRQGIASVLAKTCEIKYFYMNTKIDFAGGYEKAKEAYVIYQQFKPDGMITADDDVQAMFVVPYLKDKVKTPIMFCGINFDAAKYGYPTSNISGILEVNHIAESIALLKSLMPSVQTIGYIMRDTPTAKAVLKQIEEESASYFAKTCGTKTPLTIKEMLSAVEDLRKNCDALMTDSLDGMADDAGNALPEKELMPSVIKTFGKPVISATDYWVKSGALCAVVKTGQEQGERSAEMLLKAMQGMPVSEIPITKNHKGKRIINAAALKTFGIRPDVSVLQSAEIVKTQE
jgi:ABC-type uncharacterized transport system substrate-binding protein